MTPTSTTAGWNPTPGSNFTHTSQKVQETQSGRLNETEIPFKLQRSEYFRTQYDVLTGIRIAGTLGGFFLFVLLTLLYKSKCKKSSRIGTPVLTMESAGLDMALLNSAQSADNLTTILDPPSILMDLGGDEPTRRRHQTLYSPLDSSPAVLLTSAKESTPSSTSSDMSISPASLGSGYHHIRPPPVPTRGRVRRKRRMNWLQQNIDIHVIQPTPNISPSGSELFPRMGPSSRAAKRPKDLMTHRASDSGLGRTNPLFLLQPDSLNLKFVDDTSSENLPTRASEEDDPDSQSIGSDSVFLFQVGTQDRAFEEEEEVCRMTVSQARAQVHHRDSFCSSEVESVTDYLESHRRRSSSTQTTISDLRQCLRLGVLSPPSAPGTRTDTSCCTPSSTSLLTPAQPTRSLSPFLSNNMPTPVQPLAWAQATAPPIPNPPSPKGCVLPSPSIPHPSPYTFLTINAANVNPNPPKKRSYESLRKSCSLQCDDVERVSKEY